MNNPLLLLLSVVCLAAAAPVRVTFEEPVARGDVLHQSATINYLYVDSDHLDLYTSLGSVRMCYPRTTAPEPSPEDSIAHSEWMWAQEQETAACPILLTTEDAPPEVIEFIKQTVPARFKAWAQSNPSPNE